MMISCPEEIAYRLGLIDRETLRAQGVVLKNNEYGRYLMRLADTDLPQPDNG